MHTDMDEKNKEINYLNKKLDVSESSRRKYSEGMKLLQKEVADKMKAITQLNDTNSQLKSLYNNKEKEFFEFIREYKLREEKYKAEKKTQTASIISLQEQLNKQQAVIDALEALNKTISAENNRIKNDCNNLKMNHNQVLKSMGDELECHRIDNERLRNANLSLTLAKADLETEIEILKNKIEENAEFSRFVENLHIKNYFKGEIINGKKHGECEEKGSNYYFKGSYVDGLKTGPCILIENDIEQKGIFQNDLLQGHCLYKDLKTGKVLEGEFDNGQFIGSTILIDKVKYRGGLKSNKLEGSGYFEFTNGYFLECRFKNDNIDKTQKATIIKPDIGEEYDVKFEGNNFVVDGYGQFEINYENGELVKKDI